MPDGTSSNPTTSENWESYWQTFESTDYINYTPQLLETLQQHVSLRGAKILEVGSGTGGNASELSRLGGTVVTLDFAPTALERTRITGQKTGARLLSVQADARHLPFIAGAFDLVYHQGFLEHFNDPEKILREQRRVLKRGGYLLVDVPQLYNWYTVHKHWLIKAGRWPYGGWERQFSLRELTGLLRTTGFTPICAYGRGYFPRPFAMLRNLDKIEQKLLRRDAPPSMVWDRYNAGWRWFEKTRLGCNTLQCVGVLAKTVG